MIELDRKILIKKAFEEYKNNNYSIQYIAQLFGVSTHFILSNFNRYHKKEYDRVIKKRLAYNGHGSAFEKRIRKLQQKYDLTIDIK
jgi:transposase